MTAAERQARYYARHGEAKRLKARERYALNREVERARCDEWYRLNKDKKAAYDAQPERRAKRNAATKRHRELNREAAREKGRAGYWKDPEKRSRTYRAWRTSTLAYQCARNAQYRAQKAGAPGSCTLEQFRGRCDFYEGRCYLCGDPLNGDIVMEHRIPLSRGGTNWPANLAPAHSACNCSKGAMTETEWRAQRAKNFLKRRLGR